MHFNTVGMDTYIRIYISNSMCRINFTRRILANIKYRPMKDKSTNWDRIAPCTLSINSGRGLGAGFSRENSTYASISRR